MKDEIKISIRTDLETVEWSIGKKIFEVFQDFDGMLIPQSLWYAYKRLVYNPTEADFKEEWARLVITKGTKDHYYYKESYRAIDWRRLKKG